MRNAVAEGLGILPREQFVGVPPDHFRQVRSNHAGRIHHCIAAGGKRPREGFDKQYPELLSRAKAASPVGGLLLPSLDRMVEVRRRAQAQRLLLKAAMAVVQGGQKKLKDVKDPFGDGPFEYRDLGKGFELKSKLIFRGQPVTLTAGQGKKS